MKEDFFKEPDSWFNAISAINKRTQFEIKDLIKAGQEMVNSIMEMNLKTLELWRQIGKKEPWENIFCLVPFAYFKKYIVDNIVKVILQDWYRVEEYKSTGSDCYKIDYIPVNSNCQIIFDQLFAPIQSLHITLERISNRYSFSIYFENTGEYFGYGSHIPDIAKLATIKAITEKVEKEFFNWHFLQDNHFHIVRDMFNNGAPKEILKDFLLDKGIENQKADKLLYFWLTNEETLLRLIQSKPDNNNYYHRLAVYPIIQSTSGASAIKVELDSNYGKDFHNCRYEHYKK